MCLELGGSFPNVKITPRSPRRGPKMPPRASCTRERAPKKLGVSAWEVQIAPKSPRRAPRSAPRAPWKPPRVPGRLPRRERRGPREPPNALKTTENAPRTAKAEHMQHTTAQHGAGGLDEQTLQGRITTGRDATSKGEPPAENPYIGGENRTYAQIALSTPS